MALIFTFHTSLFDVQLIGSEFFSALGGAMSLFLGISFIMIMEIVELGWDLGMNCLNFCLSRPLGRQNHLI